MRNDKRGQGLASGIVSGTGGLIITVVMTLILVSVLLGANILTAGSTEAITAGNLSSNLSSGINQIALKIPTIFLVAAVVILFGVLAILVARSRSMTGGGGSL